MAAVRDPVDDAQRGAVGLPACSGTQLPTDDPSGNPIELFEPRRSD